MICRTIPALTRAERVEQQRIVLILFPRLRIIICFYVLTQIKATPILISFYKGTTFRRLRQLSKEYKHYEK